MPAVTKPPLDPRQVSLRCGAVLLLLAVGVFVCRDALLSRSSLYDEAIYEAAAEHVRNGESPYEVDRFFYPPVFAFALAGARDLVGEQAARWLWRWTNFLALLWIVWRSSAWAVPGERLWARLAIAGFLLTTPASVTVLSFGNMSALAGALILAGLLAAGAHPLAAGFALGVSFGVKPLVVPALAALGAPCRGTRARPWLRSPWFLAAGVGTAIASLLLLALPYAGTYVGVPIRDGLFRRSASLLRMLDLLSVPIPRALVVVTVSGCFAAIVWWRRARGRERTVWALAAAVVGAPLLWNHTFLLFYPVLMLALRTAVERSLAKRRTAASEASRWPWWIDAAAVPCLVATILYFESANLDLLANGIQVALLLPPLVSPMLLAWYATTKPDAVAKVGTSR